MGGLKRQYVIHNRYYPSQKQFADAVLRFFRETLPNKCETFRDRVTDSFRVNNHDKFRVLG
jgi:DNA gyrase inhibitor GyrI